MTDIFATETGTSYDLPSNDCSFTMVSSSDMMEQIQDVRTCVCIADLARKVEKCEWLDWATSEIYLSIRGCGR